MSTLAFQSRVQRTRFVQHAFAAVAARLPETLRSRIAPAARSGTTPTAAEAASLQAQEVREMARSYQRTDPGFASDLYAAAARHEGELAD